MGAILKGLQSVLIALGIIAVTATGIIIYYNTINPQDEEAIVAQQPDAGQDPDEINVITETETEEGTEETEGTEEGDPYISGDTAASVFSVENGHEHTYTSTVLRPATCTEAGEIKYTCFCGDFYVDAISPLDHTPGNWVTVRTATSSQTGLRQKSCTICGRVLEEETIPMLAVPVVTASTNNKDADSKDNHKHSYTYEISSEATCTEKGEKTYTCSTCGSTFKTSIPATNHPSRKTVRTEGNCANPGKIEVICNLCNAVISSETLYYEHDWGSWSNDQKTCKVCGEVKTRNGASSSTNNNNNSNNNNSNNNNNNNNSSNTGNNNNSGNNTGTTTPGANHTHTYTSSVTTPATCEAPGVTTYTCTAGDDTYTENVPEALGHRWGSWVTTKPATVDEEGIQTRTCSRCQQQETLTIAKLSGEHKHDYKTLGKIIRKPTCTEEGTRQMLCECGAFRPVKIPPLGHTWVNNPNPDGSGQICSVCGTPRENEN